MNAATHASSASKHVDAYERRGAAEKNCESKAHFQYKANFQSDSGGSYGEVCSRCGIAHGSEPKDYPAHGSVFVVVPSTILVADVGEVLEVGRQAEHVKNR